MKLYPCVLLQDFGVAKLADTITTEQVGRWSTTDDTDFNIELSRARAQWDRKSLRIATTNVAPAGPPTTFDAAYNDTGVDLTATEILNAFGDDVNDFTWCTDMGCWLYHTDDVYSGGDPDEFKMWMDNAGTQIDVNWTSDFDAADTWIWVSGTPDAGSFATNGDNVERYGFSTSVALTASSYFYINMFVAFRSTLSSASNDYTHTNALELVTASVMPSGWNSWSVKGRMVGDYVLDQARQLHEMQTIGCAPMSIIRRPTPKYQALKDCDNIKVYLMEVQGTMGTGGLYNKIVTPVIITNVQTDYVAPSKKSIEFTFDALRFAGV